LTIGNLPADSYQITAVYSGDGSFTTSTSTASTQNVGAAPSGIALTSAPNPSVYSFGKTFTATLAPAVTGTVLPSITLHKFSVEDHE
jgi:hypothetical protein